MRKELDELLCKRYPKIFVDRNAPINTTAMCWGFSCGDGWYWLIDNLCMQIQGHIDNHNDDCKQYKDKYEHYKDCKEIQQVVAVQVKEKFGGLRFYYNGGDDVIRSYVDFAESLSLKICEHCGTTENVGHTTSGWISVLCENCYKKANEEAVKKLGFTCKQYEEAYCFELNENPYDRYAEVDKLKNGDTCWYLEKKAIFVEHIDELSKKLKVDDKEITCHRRDVWLEEETFKETTIKNILNS